MHRLQYLFVQYGRCTLFPLLSMIFRQHVKEQHAKHFGSYGRRPDAAPAHVNLIAGILRTGGNSMPPRPVHLIDASAAFTAVSAAAAAFNASVSAFALASSLAALAALVAAIAARRNSIASNTNSLF